MTMTDSQHEPPAHRPLLSRRQLIVSVAAGLAIGAVLLLLALVFKLTANNSGPDSADAEAACEELVTDQLKAPSTAAFPGADRIVANGAHEWKVIASVDSENGYGAMVRTDYECTVRDVNGSWDLVSLDIDE